MKSFIVVIFAILCSFHPGVLKAEGLDESKLNIIFGPILKSLAEQEIDGFGDWFKSNALITDEIKTQIQSSINNQLVPKLPLYGSIIETRLIFNEVISEKYGRVIFIQDYENSFMLWRFDFYIKENGNISLKVFTIDHDSDLDRLYTGVLKSNGRKFDLNKSQFIF